MNLLALGLAHALGDDLLGGLRGDAAELLGFLRELDFHPDFGFVAVELLRFGERNLARGAVTSVDDRLDRVEFDLPGLEVEARAQVLVALEHLARGGQVRVFNRANDDGRVDALVLRDDVDHLLQFGSHISFRSQIRPLLAGALTSARLTPRTPLRAGAADSREGHPMRPPAFGQEHVPLFHAGQPAREMRLAVHRLARHDLRQPADEPAIVRLVPQRPIQPR